MADNKHIHLLQLVAWEIQGMITDILKLEAQMAVDIHKLITEEQSLI
jgi:hypothetical protein